MVPTSGKLLSSSCSRFCTSSSASGSFHTYHFLLISTDIEGIDVVEQCKTDIQMLSVASRIQSMVAVCLSRLLSSLLVLQASALLL